MSIAECRAETEQALTAQLVEFIEAELNAAIAQRGKAYLVVSGGNTPRPLLTALAKRPLAWDRVYITLADERWVETSSSDSNEAMVRAVLLQGPAVKANFIALKNNAETAADGQHECQQAIAELPTFDLVILGMGGDGHTASLFPGVSGKALDADSPALCQSIIPPAAPYERMTLTARTLLNSRKIVLHIVGENKWQVYQKALAEGPSDEFPIRVALHQNRAPVEVYWSP